MLTDHKNACSTSKPIIVSGYFMTTQQDIPIDVVHLLPVLDKKLLDLLKSLTPGEWQTQTIAKLWTVKDIVAHLLDGNIRILSMLRDDYYGEQLTTNSYHDLVDFLNRLKADGVKATKRVCPSMLIDRTAVLQLLWLAQAV